jgi:hypothetical protein
MRYTSMVFAAAVSWLSATVSVQAAVIQGSVAIVDAAPGGAFPTGDINTATLFVIEDPISTDNTSGIFAGMPFQFFGLLTFPHFGGLDFGTSVFGTFKGTNITEVTNTPGFVQFSVMGDWTPGTFGDVTGGPFPANFLISFNQDPAHTGVISDDGLFSVSVIPEPSTWAMMLLGFGGLGFLGYRQTRKGQAATL